MYKWWLIEHALRYDRICMTVRKYIYIIYICITYIYIYSVIWYLTCSNYIKTYSLQHLSSNYSFDLQQDVILSAVNTQPCRATEVEPWCIKCSWEVGALTVDSGWTMGRWFALILLEVAVWGKCPWVFADIAIPFSKWRPREDELLLHFASQWLQTS